MPQHEFKSINKMLLNSRNKKKRITKFAGEWIYFSGYWLMKVLIFPLAVWREVVCDCERATTTKKNRGQTLVCTKSKFWVKILHFNIIFFACCKIFLNTNKKKKMIEYTKTHFDWVYYFVFMRWLVTNFRRFKVEFMYINKI